VSDQNLRILAVVVLLVHGLGHGGALGALAWIRARPGADTGGWHAARSWLLPSMTTNAATIVASACWTVAFGGFVIAAFSLWGVLPDAIWRPLSVACALVSGAGIILFAGTWPLLNTLAAMLVNIAVLIAVLVVSWQPANVAGS